MEHEGRAALHEMRRVLRREQREAAAVVVMRRRMMVGRVALLVGEAWLRVAERRSGPCVEHEGRAAAA